LTPEATPTSALRGDNFTYDALGNRQGWNYLASRGWMNFTRRDNGLNQYWSWENNIPATNSAHWGSAIYHDDNSPWAPWNAFPGNGVTMADGWLVASYNALNQPVAMVPFGWGDAIFFGYDPLGRCVKRWVGSSGDVYSNPATYFHYEGWNLLQEGANAWGPARVYVHGTRIDEIVWSYNTFTGEQAFHHYDARGHCTLLTDRSGYALEQYEYDAFGQPYFYDASGNSIGSYDAQGRWAGYSLFGNRFLFTGREWLSDVKLYDYRNRMYQPELGRFLQPDPKQFEAGDYNLYRYCHNDPVNHVDPTGLGYDEDMLNAPEGSGAITKALGAAMHAVAQHISDNRNTYIMAAVIAGEAWRSHGYSSGMGPRTMRSPTGYRYVGKAEANVIKKTGEIPKVDAAGKPKTVFFTNERYTNAADAQKALSLPSTPEFRVEFGLNQAPAGYGGLANGGGTEFTLRETAKPISVIKLDRLDR